MHIDPAKQSAPDNYKLLTNLVVPGPIAWVTSVNGSGPMIRNRRLAVVSC